jgi:hypothetical protein
MNGQCNAPPRALFNRKDVEQKNMSARRVRHGFINLLSHLRHAPGLSGRAGMNLMPRPFPTSVEKALRRAKARQENECVKGDVEDRRKSDVARREGDQSASAASAANSAPAAASRSSKAAGSICATASRAAQRPPMTTPDMTRQTARDENREKSGTESNRVEEAPWASASARHGRTRLVRQTRFGGYEKITNKEHCLRIKEEMLR